MNRQSILETYPEDVFMFADGWDECVLGVDPKSMRVVYSASKIREQLVSRDGMEPDEAEEFFYFNIAGAYMGPQTPIYVEDADVL